MNSRLLFLQTISPLHAGTGQSTGSIDLPLARDRATGIPYLPGSSIKGSLRAKAREEKLVDIHRIFGPETDNASDYAGAALIGDAHLLLLPVRSVAGTFAYVTSPWLLARFIRDAKEVGISSLPPHIPEVNKIEECVPCENSKLVYQNNNVILEELDLKPQALEKIRMSDAWAEAIGSLLFNNHQEWKKLLKARFCLVHDDVLSFFAQHATDIVTRVSIDPETGTAKEGQLWTEESLPVETVLYSLVAAQAFRDFDAEKVFDAIGQLTKTSMRFGGKKTVGRGRCRLVLTSGGDK